MEVTSNRLAPLVPALVRVNRLQSAYDVPRVKCLRQPTSLITNTPRRLAITSVAAHCKQPTTAPPVLASLRVSRIA